jgi:AraC-like DNA-binding protein
MLSRLSAEALVNRVTRLNSDGSLDSGFQDGLSGSDVALDVGYSNPSHFAQLFRKETGLSPSDYRQQR